MRRRTSGRFIQLFKTIFKAIALTVRWLVRCMLTEMLFWSLALGVVASLFIAIGIPQNIAFPLAIAVSFSLLIIAVYISYTAYSKKGRIRRRKGEVRLAHAIARFFADSSSTEWHEYQDWLHDILLARRQLLDRKCPVWKVKLITYWRLTAFCLVVSMNKVKQVVASMRRSS